MKEMNDQHEHKQASERDTTTKSKNTTIHHKKHRTSKIKWQNDKPGGTESEEGTGKGGRLGCWVRLTCQGLRLRGHAS